MNYSALIQNRKSTREFTDKEITFAQLETIRNYYYNSVRRLVPDSFHVGNHLQCRRDDSKVPGHRLLLQKQLHADVFNVFFFPFLRFNPKRSDKEEKSFFMRRPIPWVLRLLHVK